MASHSALVGVGRTIADLADPYSSKSQTERMHNFADAVEEVLKEYDLPQGSIPMTQEDVDRFPLARVEHNYNFETKRLVIIVDGERAYDGPSNEALRGLLVRPRRSHLRPGRIARGRTCPGPGRSPQ